MRLQKMQPKLPETMEFTQNANMPENHIYNNLLFGSIIEFVFVSFLAFRVICPFFMSGQLTPLAELPATVIAALHHDKTLCNLFIHAHLNQN